MAYSRREPSPRRGSDRHGFARPVRGRREDRDSYDDRRGAGRRDSAGGDHRPSGGDDRRRQWDGARAGRDRTRRALRRANAENIARHLVMLQRLLDTDPELAHQHARYAVSHAGRIAVVRESAGIAAYLSGHYQEALRDIRAARRLSGLDLHRAIEADCERALGNLERALKAAQGADPAQLDDQEEAEIAMVVSSVRHEMGQTELGLVVIEEAILMFRGDRETLRRLHSVRADRLEELGRVEEAEAVRVRIGEGPQEVEEEIEVYDVAQETDEGLQEQGPQEVADEEPSAGADPDPAVNPAEGPEDDEDAGAAEDPRPTSPTDEEE